MKHIKSFVIAVAMIGLIAAVQVHAQMKAPVTTDPEKAPLIFDDVRNFIRAHELLKGNSDSVAVLKREYFDKGTAGLAMFIEKYNLTPERLAKAIQKYPEDYAALATNIKLLEAQAPAIRQGYAELKRLVSNAAFPPTYFLVDAHRGIGSGSVVGTLITVEKESPESITGDLAGTLVHEMVHMLQLQALGEKYFVIFNEEKSLLALSIREGVAEFLAYLITNGNTFKAPVWKYLIAHEADLWSKFEPAMLGKETGDWLWAEPANPKQPRDVGYIIGARIVETYYNNSTDKASAAREIISISDYKGFVEKSGYRHQIDLKSVANNALRLELLQMQKEDQTARIKAETAHGDHALFAEVERIDAKNTARMKEIVKQHGWPGKRLVGTDGATAAWLLVQHADKDPVFQKHCLELMKAAPKGEIRMHDIAYLTDRVLVNEGKKQIYGTQFIFKNGKPVPQPIEDEANVDKRRKEAGLPPLAEAMKWLKGHAESSSHDHKPSSHEHKHD